MKLYRALVTVKMHKHECIPNYIFWDFSLNELIEMYHLKQCLEHNKCIKCHILIIISCFRVCVKTFLPHSSH